jgi:hypothetical protein
MSSAVANLAKSALKEAGAAAEKAVEEEATNAVVTAIQSGGKVDPNQLAAQAVTNMAAKVQSHAQEAASAHVPSLPKPDPRLCEQGTSSEEGTSSESSDETTDTSSSSDADVENAKSTKKSKKSKKSKKVQKKRAKKRAKKKAQQVGGRLTSVEKYFQDALFDKYLEAVIPNNPAGVRGYLLTSFVFLCTHAANMLGVMIYCIVRYDRLYWQITLFAFQDLRAAWNAEFGWIGLCLAVLGFAYQMITFFQRTMLHSPRQGRVWFCLSEKRSQKISNSIAEAQKKGDMTVRWFWIPAGLSQGIMNASVLAFVGGNQFLLLVLVIVCGIAQMYILSQEDPKDSRLETQNTHMAISLECVIVGLIMASFFISMGNLETDWVNTSVGGVFGIYVTVQLVWMIVVGVTRNSKVFDLFLDGIMAILVIFVSWLIVGSSAYRHQIPDNICGSTLITGCTS